MHSRERLVVALDMPGYDETIDLARKLRGEIGLVKVGLESYTAHGPALVRALVELELGVFLDLKIHDIPRTAAAAVREATRLGARLVTVHALGGAEMVRAAVDAAEGQTEVIAVTLLTSMDDAAVAALGIRDAVPGATLRLGELALAHGADGLVCSALELGRISHLGKKRVVPGIRPEGSKPHDQKRIATPRQAVAAGATWLVVGRPIIASEDPVAVARSIVAEMDDAAV